MADAYSMSYGEHVGCDEEKKKGENIFRTDQSSSNKSNDVLVFDVDPSNFRVPMGNRVKKPFPIVQ